MPHRVLEHLLFLHASELHPLLSLFTTLPRGHEPSCICGQVKLMLFVTLVECLGAHAVLSLPGYLHVAAAAPLAASRGRHFRLSRIVFLRAWAVGRLTIPLHSLPRRELRIIDFGRRCSRRCDSSCLRVAVTMFLLVRATSLLLAPNRIFISAAPFDSRLGVLYARGYLDSGPRRRWASLRASLSFALHTQRAEACARLSVRALLRSDLTHTRLLNAVSSRERCMFSLG